MFSTPSVLKAENFHLPFEPFPHPHVPQFKKQMLMSISVYFSKWIPFILATFLTGSHVCAQGDFAKNDYVKIDSITTDNSIPHGKCKISGSTDFDDVFYIQSMKSFSPMVISENFGEFTKTFEILVDTSIQYIQFVAASELVHPIYLEDRVFLNQKQVHVHVIFPPARIPIQVEKPVIYAYSPKKLHAELHIQPIHGDFTFVYPAMQTENTWKIQVSPNSNLLVDNRVEVPYLFWEGESTQLAYQFINGSIKGEFVVRDSVIAFLENKLDQFGFNAREKTDFITFWGPRLMQHERNFVQFLWDDAYEKNIASLQVSPTPDAIRRVYLLHTAIPDSFKYKPSNAVPLIPPFKRNGFTIVEWGGSTLPIESLMEIY